MKKIFLTFVVGICFVAFSNAQSKTETVEVTSTETVDNSPAGASAKKSSTYTVNTTESNTTQEGKSTEKKSCAGKMKSCAGKSKGSCEGKKSEGATGPGAGAAKKEE